MKSTGLYICVSGSSLKFQWNQTEDFITSDENIFFYQIKNKYK